MHNNIILCFDGTDSTFGSRSPSNILELYKLLEKNSPYQTCFYQPGVGIDIDLSQHSFHSLGIQTAIKNKLDSAIAFSIDYHVIQAYRYLIKIYQPDDKIFLFGFSRGSFIARILAGMIEKIGLLDRGLEGMVKTAWEIYKDWEMIGQPTDLKNPARCSYSIKLFKQTFCRYNVSIEFMGLFDSINSCGILFDKLFPFTSNSSNVKHIRHAVSIHERRSKFKQNLFIPHTYLPHFLDSNSSCDSSINNDNISTLSHLPVPDEDSVTRSNVIDVHFSKKCSSDLIEVWFPGDHSDVGGSWPYDDSGHKLGNLSMRWILSFAIEFGVIFKENSLNEFDSKFNPLSSSLSFQHDILSFKGYNYPHYASPYCLYQDSDSIIESRYDLDNSTQKFDNPTYNHLSNPTSAFNQSSTNNIHTITSPLFPNFSKYTTENTISELQKINAYKGHGDESVITTLFWWCLEVLPIGYLVENKIGRWRPLYWPNFGESRNIPHSAKVHWSILWRMKFVKDVEYENLPAVFKRIKKIIDDDNNDDNYNRIIMNPNGQHIVLKIIDLVDFKTGSIKPDIDKIISNIQNSEVVIKLDIDWENPPNEIEKVMNIV